MTSPSKKTAATPSAKPAIIVRNSPVHGRGVFATRNIPADTFLIEYEGERISDKEASKRHGLDPENPYHTFFFSLESGKMIDGGVDGSDARWINHACEPNCEAREEKKRVNIYSLRDIKRGEELNYDYGLVVEDKQTKALKKAYECRCGAETCRHTMLAPPEKKKAKKKTKAKKSKKD
ncbi:MAG: SET domain-containing protein-lysine N-methyltransferase [Herminiimonas sp.]|uniref:SET domain-containing protein n=1 Tax=Herminiimonas sp. TaxID=1926289 RepID=UPI00271E4E77|nr:SET domain-containing protein-lysine N-methyltransferase [Herminiimonas sp.]MDO9419153.1 SET domain-containing protein-lysine N-methyltransferase [Herminiimonas sp.]